MNTTPHSNCEGQRNVTHILATPIGERHLALKVGFKSRQIVVMEQGIGDGEEGDGIGGFWGNMTPQVEWRKYRAQVELRRQMIDVEEEIVKEEADGSLDSSDNLINGHQPLHRIPFFMRNYREDNMDIQIPQQHNYQFQLSNKHPSPNTLILFTKQDRDKKQKIAKIQQIGCNCRKSKCLKMYCQCFHLQIFCSQNCNCVGCGNMEPNHSHNQAVIEALTRNPRAFHEESPQAEGRFKLQVGLSQVKKGCRCKKTKCLKKYCECYHSAIPCGIFCKCQGCQNSNNQNNQILY